jgi:hypothetical protein
MSMIGVSRSALASVEEKAYSLQVSLSVFVGLVRASLQDQIPLLSKHPVIAVAAACVLVVFIQFLILGIAVVSKLLTLFWLLPALVGGLLAYVPLMNK